MLSVRPWYSTCMVSRSTLRKMTPESCSASWLRSSRTPTTFILLSSRHRVDDHDLPDVGVAFQRGPLDRIPDAAWSGVMRPGRHVPAGVLGIPFGQAGPNLVSVSLRDRRARLVQAHVVEVLAAGGLLQGDGVDPVGVVLGEHPHVGAVRGLAGLEVRAVDRAAHIGLLDLAHQATERRVL